MSSDPEPTVDEFTQFMTDAGFKVTDLGETTVDETFEYTGVGISYFTEDGLPISVRIEYPIGRAMDAARAAVLTGSADNVKVFLAGAADQGDASVQGYLEANGIDVEQYVEQAFDEAGPEAPPLGDADGFFTIAP